MSQTRRDWIRRSWFGGIAAVLGGLFVSRRSVVAVRSRWLQRLHRHFDKTEKGDTLRFEVWVPDEMLLVDPPNVIADTFQVLCKAEAEFAVDARRQFLLTGKWPQDWLDAQPKLEAWDRSGRIA